MCLRIYNPPHLPKGIKTGQNWVREMKVEVKRKDGFTFYEQILCDNHSNVTMTLHSADIFLGEWESYLWCFEDILIVGCFFRARFPNMSQFTLSPFYLLWGECKTQCNPEGHTGPRRQRQTVELSVLPAPSCLLLPPAGWHTRSVLGGQNVILKEPSAGMSSTGRTTLRRRSVQQATCHL